MKILTKILVMLLAVCAVIFFPVAAQNLDEQFAVLIKNLDGTAEIQLVDPVTLQVTRVSAIPIQAGDVITNAFLSPTGEWAVLHILSEQSSLLRLFNLYSGEVVPIHNAILFPDSPLSIGSDFPVFAWSPNGLFFAFHNMQDTNHQGTFLYDINARDLVNLTDQGASQYHLTWSNNSSHLALINISCDEIGCSHATINLYDPYSASITNTINILELSNNAFDQATNFCELHWNTDDTYLAFFDYCDVSGLGVSREVYIANSVDGSLTQVTNLTPTDVPASESVFTAITELQWIDTEVLLIGGETLMGQIFVSPGVRNTFTIAYNRVTQTTSDIDPQRRGEWARGTETSKRLAYLNYVYDSDPNSGLVISNANVEVAVWDGLMLISQGTGPSGCLLSWDRSTDILAYIDRDVNAVRICEPRFDRMYFIDDTGIQIFNSTHETIALGWYIIPQNIADVRIQLTSMCYSNPEATHVWRVRNTNPYPVNFTWDVVGTSQTGSGTVAPLTANTPGETFFTTTTVAGPNTTRIYVNGVQQDSISNQCSQPPTSNAGVDQTVSDATDTVLITLDGSSSSDPDGMIISYVWTENGVEIATGATPQVTLSVGTHTITLTVTDDDGASATDDVVVTVEKAVNQPPVAVAQYNIIRDNGNAVSVTLYGAASYDVDGVIVEYIWYRNGVLVEVQDTSTPNIYGILPPSQPIIFPWSTPIPPVTFTLVVIDNDGLSHSHTVNYNDPCICDSWICLHFINPDCDSSS